MNDSSRTADATPEAEEALNCLEEAVKRFNKSNDRDTLLKPGEPANERWTAAGERAIAHRLAFYLECELRKLGRISDTSDLVVDCEYNRHNGAPKAFKIKEELKEIVTEARKKKWGDPDEDGFYVFSIAPDIIVHKRGDDERNRLIIEIKKASNPEEPKYDALKLELFTAPKEELRGFGYDYGAWVIVEDKCEPRDRLMRIAAKYQNGKKQ